MSHKIDCQVRKKVDMTNRAKELSVHPGMGRLDLRKMPSVIRVPVSQPISDFVGVRKSFVCFRIGIGHPTCVSATCHIAASRPSE